jgi:hypothetical protein
MPNANEDVEIARAWLRGESGLFEDLADIVASMIDEPLDPAARTFLSTIGRDAKALAKSKARPTTPATPSRSPSSSSPTPEPTAAPTISLDEMMRRRRERERARRIEAWGRYNNEAWADQAEMVRGMGTGGDWGR